MVFNLKKANNFRVFLIILNIIFLTQNSLILGKNSELNLEVPAKFKKELKNKIEKDISFIQKIIKEGEEDSSKKDLYDLLEAQKEWLSQNIVKINYFFDNIYESVIKKSDKFNSLSIYQKQADELLAQNLINFKLKINKALFKRIRLVIFYEINNMLQAGESDISGKIEKIIINILKQLLDNKKVNIQEITESIEPEAKKEPEVKKSTELEEKLEKERESLKKQTLNLEITLKKESILKNKEIESLQASIKTKEEEINKLKKEFEANIKNKEDEILKLKKNLEEKEKQQAISNPSIALPIDKNKREILERELLEKELKNLKK